MKKRSVEREMFEFEQWLSARESDHAYRSDESGLSGYNREVRMKECHAILSRFRNTFRDYMLDPEDLQ